MACLKNYVIISIYYVPAKLYNQRTIFSHDVEMNNKGILHFTYLPVSELCTLRLIMQ